MSVFSNPKVLAAAKAFLPAADEVWRLQRGGDAECLFFQRAVNGGKAITDNGTRQGIYVMSPSGQVLSRVNSLKPDAVLAMMERGLAAWQALPEAARHLPAEADIEGSERWEDSRPEDGLLLERFVRDLPPEGKPDGTRATRWNGDSLWLSKEEARSLIPQEEGWIPIPTALAHRLASFTLVDNVYGQCIPFDAGDLREVRIEVRRSPIDGGLQPLEFRGHTLAVEDGKWTLGENLWKPHVLLDHAMETTLHGRAVFDPQAQAFTAFTLMALGRRNGFTELNSRRFRPDPGGIGFLFRLDRREWSPAPTFLSLYGADWVRPPTTGRELRRD